MQEKKLPTLSRYVRKSIKEREVKNTYLENFTIGTLYKNYHKLFKK